jgi:hypothetical protein
MPTAAFTQKENLVMLRSGKTPNKVLGLGIGMIGWLFASTAFATGVPAAGQRCATFSGTATPISHCPATNYLCYAGILKFLVGVSADVGCHIPLSDNLKCNLSNSQDVLLSTMQTSPTGAGLNKTRVWVAIAGNSPITTAFHDFDHPFAYVRPVGVTPGYWRLDIPNTTYFNNLQNVIDFCREGGVNYNTIVEVTFFAPWEGTFAGGPWDGANGKVCVDGLGNFQPADTTCTGVGHSLVTAGFSSQDQFVRPGNDPVNGNRPRQVQLNLIKWTIDRLYCYDNIYWEIANEPEAGSVDATTVSQWQANMITQAVNVENTYVGANPGVTTRHMIAVNPTKTTIDYVNGAGALANVGIINGHYTELFTTAGDLGAIQLIQRKGNTAMGLSKLLGFNETKISAITGTAGTLPAGGPESARAEGWEFMLSHAAVYDHWGYDYSSANGVAVRNQMKSLRGFVGGLQLRTLIKSAADTTSAPTAPAWVSSLPTWGTYNATRAARLFWTAMEPTVGATIPQYVLYLHNSLRRCKAGFSEPGCSGTASQLLPFNSYSPVITNNGYSETLSLTLPAGTYTAQWVKPENNTNLAGSPFNLVINANGSCTGSPNPPCKITSPGYSYDIALKLTKQ